MFFHSKPIRIKKVILQFALSKYKMVNFIVTRILSHTAGLFVKKTTINIYQLKIEHNFFYNYPFETYMYS